MTTLENYFQGLGHETQILHIRVAHLFIDLHTRKSLFKNLLMLLSCTFILHKIMFVLKLRFSVVT